MTHLLTPPAPLGLGFGLRPAQPARPGALPTLVAISPPFGAAPVPGRTIAHPSPALMVAGQPVRVVLASPFAGR